MLHKGMEKFFIRHANLEMYALPVELPISCIK
jgi:hypothetical protein